MDYMEAYKAYKPSFRRTEWANLITAFPSLHRDEIGKVVKPHIARHTDARSTGISVGVVVRYKDKSQVRKRGVFFFVSNDIGPLVRYGNL